MSKGEIKIIKDNRYREKDKIVKWEKDKKQI
jgi:hypothetical protein